MGLQSGQNSGYELIQLLQQIKNWANLRQSDCANYLYYPIGDSCCPSHIYIHIHTHK